jgi:pSer/pThr/pTyr-binding forkhead associated (FHA) protein
VARLLIKYKSGDTEEVNLPDKITTLGRTPANTVQLSDSLASRKHCLIKLETDVYLLRDLKSGNGTSVNGQRIKDHWLEDGDLIKIGNTVLKFVED